MVSGESPRLTWLDRYASTKARYKWQVVTHHGRTLFHRPLGLVELAFDSDGRFYEGRADVNATLSLRVRTRLSSCAVRQRILRAWTRLRVEHALLRAKAWKAGDFLPTGEWTPRDVHFVIEKPCSEEALQAETAETIVFLQDFYQKVDPREFYRHSQNVARIVNPDVYLAKVFVFPLEAAVDEPEGTYDLRLQMTAAHQITEGLTMRNWWTHFLVLLNDPPASLNLDEHFSQKVIEDRFPLAQETLYHPISNNLARQRWFWAITIVLQHVQKPVAKGLENPLQREDPIPSGSARRLEPVFEAVLDYSKVPPLNTFTAGLDLSKRATHRMHRLCRESGASVGAGAFALTALAAMEFYEARFPDIPLEQRRPFVASFPLNPRAMFALEKAPDSLMLAFSQGIELPFLPSHLAIEGRFKLLVRRADDQLRVYQKRTPKTIQERVEKDKRRILAQNYIAMIERSNYLLPPELRPVEGSEYANPRGAYPKQNEIGHATHGVSSIGLFGGLLVPGKFDLNQVSTTSSTDFVADYRGLSQGVRARDNEFLCGVGGSADYLGIGVSFDGNAIDEDRLEHWKEKLKGFFDHSHSHDPKL